jgi:hypothetical protein
VDVLFGVTLGGLRQLFTDLSLTPSVMPDGDSCSHAAPNDLISIVESVMLCDTALWKGNGPQYGLFAIRIFFVTKQCIHEQMKYVN